MNALNQEQIDFFAKNGYLVLERVFDDEEVAAMREAADWILALILNSSLANGRLSRRLDWRMNSSGTQVVRKIQPINDLSLTFAQVSDDERLTEPMAQIMGEQPVLMEEKLNYKQPLPDPVGGLQIRQLDDSFPMHNDWAYFQQQNYPQSVLSSALLLDECTSENGPLRIWPGTHKKHVEHESGDNGLHVADGLIDPAGGVDMLAPAGSFMIFHSLVVHNSRANGTNRPRRLMIYSHYPESLGMPYDVRNGPIRLRESPWELEYLQMKEAGKFKDRFHSPVYLEN